MIGGTGCGCEKEYHLEESSMKKCKKCGRPLGKNGLCAHCDKEKAGKKKKNCLPWVIAGAAVAAVVAVVLILTLGGKDEGKTPDDPQDATAQTVAQELPLDNLEDKHHVEIEIQNYGTVSVELDGGAAPKTVENFLKLAKEGFYNGLTFHRIMEGFMMQGGDPLGNGTGGSDTQIFGEFSANGWENNLSHTRGAISMARSQDYNSASSQFFIVQQDSTFLDGQYACFGYVTDGMDIVDQICTSAQPTDGNGTIPADQQPVITEVRVID